MFFNKISVSDICQSFSEIRRISEKVWYEAHQNLTLIRAAMKIDVAVRLEVIYDFSGDQ